MRTIYILIPSFNEELAIEKVIDDLKSKGYKNIIVVDDGSIDDTYIKAKNCGVIALQHSINRGQGAAIQTGLDAAKILNADIVVTFDSDGQHESKDIERLINPIIENKADVVLGSRFMQSNKIPLFKRLLNYGGNLVTYIFYGVYVTDSQSGMRAYSKKAYTLIKTYMDKYEFASEVLGQIKYHKLKYLEVPIIVNYTDYSKSKYLNVRGFQRQNALNGFRMLFRMIIKGIFS